MSLTKYKSMRKFRKTPEPAGAVKKSPSRRLEFVVHKHQASHLHYDFRLELDGVLKSWAVPKGPSMNPKDRRLAVMVEDHPYEYRTFEGNIPEGNYGAGSVIIWDKGTYEAPHDSKNSERQLKDGLRKGHLDFVMHGQKLKGRFALIKRQNEEKSWLLIKKHDEFADGQDITLQDTSAVSGQTLEELDVSDMGTELSSIKKTALPEAIKPMLATLVDAPFSKKGWLFELKLDGYRAIGAKRSGKVQLYSRSGQNFSKKYADVAKLLKQLPGNTVIDGEIVIIDNDGKPQFNWLQNWGNKHRGNLRYFVFDLLWYEGKDVRDLPLTDRKKLLKRILPKDSALVYCDHIEEQGRELYDQIKQAGLEGVMAKRNDSPYKSGARSEDWLKIKTHLRQEVVIGGFTEPRGSRKHLGSLLLGVYEKNKLRYVGHSGGGLASEQLKSLRERLRALERPDSPFDKQPKPNAPVHWTDPKLLCEVTFSEWTPDHRMRQPKFIGLRDDKAATTVKAEHAQSANMVIHKKSVVSPQLEITHSDKLFWPDLKITKGNLAEYYQMVSGRMLPYLIQRPHVLLRHPNGYGSNGFFQKDVTNPPEGVQTVPLHSESTNQNVNYLVCTGAESLMYMVQIGCIEINPWHSTVERLEYPDWIVMDLDPEGIGFKAVVQVARTIKKLCDEWNLPSYPKTSGKSGLHVYVPTGGSYDYAQIKQFSELMAIHIHAREPGLTSLERMPSKRKGKIYIDYLRNALGQTVAAPYSARPAMHATISMPLSWDEITPTLKPTDFTIKNIAARLGQPDPWKEMLGQSIDLAAVLSALS